MIERLQQIKKLRLIREELLLTTQQGKLQLAYTRQHDKEQESQRYRQWRMQEENRLFTLCQTQQFNRKALKQWQQKVALLREKEAQLEQKAAELAEQVAEERTRLQEQQLAVHHARKKQEKFSELHRQEQVALQAMCDYFEEQEQESFRQQTGGKLQ